MLEYAAPVGGLFWGGGTPGDGPSWRKWVTRGGFIEPASFWPNLWLPHPLHGTRSPSLKPRPSSPAMHSAPGVLLALNCCLFLVLFMDVHVWGMCVCVCVDMYVYMYTCI